MSDSRSRVRGIATTVAAMNVREVVTAPHSPWQNAYVERFIGSVRRDCPDHVIVVSATSAAPHVETAPHLIARQTPPNSPLAERDVQLGQYGQQLG